MKWRVTVTRVATASRDIVVEADTREEAESKAEEDACNEDFTCCVNDFEFGVDGSTPMGDEEVLDGGDPKPDPLPGYRYLAMNETVQEGDRRYESPGKLLPGQPSGWVEVPALCFGETVEDDVYIRKEDDFDPESEEKRCPDLNGIVNDTPPDVCSVCLKTPFPGVSNETIDAGWVPSYWIGEDEMEGPVCPNCAKQFLVNDPQYGESVLNLKGTYISQWDGGIEVKSPCTVDPRTRKVAIEHAADVKGSETMEREYVVLNDREYEAAHEDYHCEYTPEQQSQMFFWE